MCKIYDNAGHLAQSVLLFCAKHLHFCFEERDVLQATAHIRAGGGAHLLNQRDEDTARRGRLFYQQFCIAAAGNAFAAAHPPLDLSDASRNVLLAVTFDSPLRTNTRFKYLVSLAGHAPPIPLGIFKNEGSCILNILTISMQVSVLFYYDTFERCFGQ